MSVVLLDKTLCAILSLSTLVLPHVSKSGFQNLGNICLWNPEFQVPLTQNPESTAWNPQSKTVLDYLTWSDYSAEEALFFHGFQASKGKRQAISLLTLLFKSWHWCIYLYKPKAVYFKRWLILVRKMKSQPFLILKRWITWVFLRNF